MSQIGRPTLKYVIRLILVFGTTGNFPLDHCNLLTVVCRIFDIMKDRLLSSDGEHNTMVLLDSIVKNCNVEVLTIIPEELISAIIEVADRDDENCREWEYAFELLYDWYKLFEKNQEAFPSLFGQEEELRHCFFLRFNEKIKPE